MQADIVNIYGDILNSSSLLIAGGNFNTVNSLLIQDDEKNLSFHSTSNILIPSILEFMISYEYPIAATPNKTYFSLQTGENYLNVSINEKGQAIATLGKEKAIFSLDYSAIDRSPRFSIMAGNLYSLQTIFGEQTYTVTWRFDASTYGNLIMFLPTVWYEEKICQPSSGIDILVSRLNQLYFKGFTTNKWCRTTPNIKYCQNGNGCGNCLGYCLDPSQICYSSPDTNNFICGYPQFAPDMTQIEMETEVEEVPPPTTGTGPTWVAIIIIFIIVILLSWGLNTRLKIE